MFYEIIIRLNGLNFITNIFYKVLYMTIIGSIVGLIIYFIRNIFDNKISGRWKCIMWGIALVTLLVPIRFEIQTTKTPVIQNGIIDRVEEIKYIAQYEEVQDPQDEENLLSSNINENQEDITSNSNIQNLEKQSIIPFKTVLINIVIPYIWLFGSFLFILTFVNGIRKINKRIARNVYKDERIENILRECKNQLHIKKKVKIILQKYKKVPSIFGIFNPSILITEQILNEDNETIKYIFLHELSHYKRKDILFNFVLLCVLSIHWFNPIIWFLFKKIRQDIEIGADELASKGLNQIEKKEYGMVLINLLRRNVEENYTASMLCMSDTGKNMERRILMIKRKSTSIILSMLLLIIIVGAVVGFVFVKTTNIKDSKLISENNFSFGSNNEENVKGEPITDDEKVAVTEYIDEICNQFFTYTLPEFSGINNADRYWIYAHLKIKEDKNGNQDEYFTKKEIEEYLENIFGDELKLDIEKDILELEPMLVSSEVFGIPNKYILLITGDLIAVEYIIDDIRKVNEEYIVKVIEYTNSRDIQRNMDENKAVYAYEENDNQYMKDWKRIFSSDGMTEQAVKDEVLSRKNEFRAFNIILKKDNTGYLRVNEIEIDNNIKNIENQKKEDRKSPQPPYIKDRGELEGNSGLRMLNGIETYENNLIEVDMVWNNNCALYHKIITNMNDYNKYSSRIDIPQMSKTDFDKYFLVIVANENLKPKDECDLYVFDVKNDETTTHIIMKQKDNPIIHSVQTGIKYADGTERNYESDNSTFWAIVDNSLLKDNVDVIIEN